jgi:lysophospholipase L1-like esterase
VNDVWRKLGEWNGQKHIPLPQFRRNLVRLVDTALSAGVRRLVLMSPTTIENENDGPLNQLLAEYDAYVRELAAAQQAVYVPARAAFLRARELFPAVQWAPDGCHPSGAGHALLAHEWLKAVGLV